MVAYLTLYPTYNKDLFVYLIGEMDAEYLTARYGDKKPSKKPEPQVTTMNVNQHG